MPRRRNKKKGKAPAEPEAQAKTTSAVPALGSDGDISNLAENLRRGIHSFLSSLRVDCRDTYAEHLQSLQKSLEAHLRSHYSSIQSDATWERILGWRPWHSTASARESVYMHMPVSVRLGISVGDVS